MSRLPIPSLDTADVLPERTPTHAEDRYSQLLQETMQASELLQTAAPLFRNGVAGVGFNVVRDAINSEWASSWAIRQFQRRPYDIDPSFELNDEVLAPLTEGLPEDTWDAFADATSLSHAQRIREQLLDVQQSRERLASLGWSGMGVRMMASMLDPVQIVAGAATGGLSWAAKGGRLARIAKAGLVNAAADTAVTGYIATQDPDMGYKDILYNAAGSFLLGGPVIAGGVEIAGSLRRLRKEIELDDLAASMGVKHAMGAAGMGTEGWTPEVRRLVDERLTPEGKRRYAEVIGEGADERRIESFIEQNDLDPVEDGELIDALREHGAQVRGTAPREPRGVEEPPTDSPRVPSGPEGEELQTNDDFLYRSFDSPDEAIGGARHVLKGTATGYGGAYTIEMQPKAAKEVGTNQSLKTKIDPNRVTRVFYDTEYYGDFNAPWGAPGQIDPNGLAEVRKLFPNAELIPVRPNDSETSLVRQRIPDAAKEIDHLPATKAISSDDGPPPKLATDLDLSWADGAAKAWGWLRHSMVGQLGRSKSAMTRKASWAMAQDALNRVGPDGKIVGGGTAASEKQRMWHDTYMARFYREANQSFREWAKENGARAVFNPAERRKFFEAVGLAVREDSAMIHPSIRKTAQQVRVLQKELLELAQRHGAKGFSKIESDPRYLMRLVNRGALTKAMSLYNREELEKMVAAAIERGSEEIETEKAAKLARAWLKAHENMGKYTDVRNARIFSSDASDVLADTLRAEVPGITAEQIEDIIYVTRPRSDTANTPSRARRRISMDENYAHPMSDGKSLAISDLLVNDAEILMNAYSRQITGHAAMAEVFRVMKTEPNEVLESFEQLKRKLANDGAEEAELSKLETMYKHVMGLRMNPDTSFNRFLRNTRMFNFIRVGGQFGFAQIPEVGALVGEAGVKAMVQQMPALQHVFSRAADGTLTNELLEEMETIIGVGTDWLTNQVTARFDDLDNQSFWGGDGLSQALQQGGRITQAAGFLAPMNVMLQRMAGALAAQRITNDAFGKAPSAKRLASLGMDRAMWDRVSDQVRKHATVEEGMTGKSIRRVNLDKWDDSQAGAAMVTALDKWSRRVVQDNDIGAMSQWMTKETGKTLLQFRTYVAVAWEKQFLHRVQMRDWQAFSGAAWASFMGSVGYVATTYVNSVGRADAEEYRRERLSPGKIFRNGFARSGFAAFLPSIVDSAQMYTGGDPLFGYARTSQLDADIIGGNPTVSFLFKDAPRALGGIGRAIRGKDELDQNDARAASRLLPFQNIMGVRNVLEAIGSQLPE